jgi:hypothetical protein
MFAKAGLAGKSDGAAGQTDRAGNQRTNCAIITISIDIATGKGEPFIKKMTAKREQIKKMCL